VCLFVISATSFYYCRPVRYGSEGKETVKSNAIINAIFYTLKPFIPRFLQISARRAIASRKLQKCEKVWPIDARAAKAPDGWKGWPEKKKFALVLIHDVDTAKGQDQCVRLMEIEKQLGFRSSFNFVPERYLVKKNIHEILAANDFEVGVHGLKHDGKLFVSRKLFDLQAPRINRYLEEWGVRGFSSPSMLRNLDWMLDLNIGFSTSSFDTDPFEPQPEGMGTIFPFWVGAPSNGKGFIELPYTLVQDFTLFVIMREKTIDVWKRKIDWIAAHGGMALVNTHPDYMNFSDKKCTSEEYPVERYKKFLHYVSTAYQGQFWHSVPSEIAKFWKREVLKTG
jgi:hypothetical protein